jgi:hypothetical protein
VGSQQTRFVFAVVTLIGGLLASAGCAPGAGGVSSGTDDEGSVELALQAAPNVRIDTVGYAITGPGSFSKAGTLDVSNSTTIGGVIGPLPAGAAASWIAQASALVASADALAAAP